MANRLKEVTLNVWLNNEQTTVTMMIILKTSGYVLRIINNNYGFADSRFEILNAKCAYLSEAQRVFDLKLAEYQPMVEKSKEMAAGNLQSAILEFMTGSPFRPEGVTV